MATQGDTVMECPEVRRRLHDLRRRRLDPAATDAVVRHLDQCAACRREDEAEALLDRLLLERLPRPPVTPALRTRLEAITAEIPPQGEGKAPRRLPGPRPARTAARWARLAAPALAAALAVAVGAVVWERSGSRRGDSMSRLADEAVADHLRVLALAHPRDIESSASHEVKPWFEGRLDFAPNVPRDVGELRLRGGSVGYFLDRKAAVISYALRRHEVTLLAFPTHALAWPEPSTEHGFPARGTILRGINVILWRHGDVGYALVADVNAAELWRVAGDLYKATAT